LTEGKKIGGTEDFFQTLCPGLYLVPSPLGNLGDISQRAVNILKAATLIAAEDTRRSIKLLNHFQISVPLLSYREENHTRAWPKIRDTLKEDGIVVLLSDAGAPLISDPGALLVREARAEGYSIFPIPGPSAVVTALLASGFTLSGFTFAGFPPSKSNKRLAYFGSLKDLPHPVVFFVAPHHLTQTLEDLYSVFGERKVLLAREMTKIHEEYLLSDLSFLIKDATLNPRKGEITLVVEGIRKEGSVKEDALDPEGEFFKNRDLILSDLRPSKILAEEWAARLGAPKRLLYRLIVELRDKE
jgi:16S rRNA (cytidine1402-2'-O)-methyltransferase